MQLRQREHHASRGHRDVPRRADVADAVADAPDARADPVWDKILLHAAGVEADVGVFGWRVGRTGVFFGGEVESSGCE